MARTLVRYVFPQFAFRVTVVVAIAAFGVLIGVQRTRTVAITDELTRHANSIETVRTYSEPEQSDRVLSSLAANLEIEIALFAETQRPLWSSSQELARTVAPRIGSLQVGEPFVARPAISRGHMYVVAQRFPADGSGGTIVVAVGRSSRVTNPGYTATSVSFFLILPLLVGVILVVSYRVVRGINSPLFHLQIAAQHFAEGDLDYRCVVHEPQELARLAETMNSMAVQLTARVDAIRSQRSQLEAILAGMVEGVILVDDLYQIRTMNRAARTLFDVESVESADGRPRTLLEVLRNSDIYELVEATVRSGETREEHVVIYNNPARHLLVHGSRVELGRERLILLVLNDITRLHELEQIRKEFVANVSHELKTPLTSIKGFVETLRDGALDDRQEADRFLEIIASHTERLTLIVEDLLQLSRLEQRKQPVPREDVGAREMLDSILSSVRSRAHAKNMTILGSCTTDGRFTVNRRLMEQAITNLIDNAINYGTEGGTISVRFETDNERQLMEVIDDGPGIAAVDLPRLFERFFRVERARSRSNGGTGLGLAIVKHIVQAHGGTVHATSARGEGSTFSIVIMRDLQDEERSAERQ